MKKLTLFSLLLIFLIVSILSALRFLQTESSSDDKPFIDDRLTETNENKQSAGRSLEEYYLSYVMPRDLTRYAHIEVVSLKNIATSSDKAGPFIELTVFPKQEKKNRGVRSELAIDYPYKEGDTVEYSWQFKIPKDFPSDTPKNRWWIFAQWHDQPDKSKGETWDTYQAHSPPILFGYGNADGKDILSLSTGIDGSEEGITSKGLIPFTRDAWHSIKIKITWSQKSDGRVLVFFDNSTTPILDAKGPTMINAYQHYMKMGQYRNAEIETENTVYLKNISIRKL